MPNLVGIGNSQVPTNAMLGGLAYQDSVGEINLDKIKARTSDTAVDIFVYDTRKDSDGGAWRHRTQNTSWYNEGVSKSRGARKEFPVVAVIVVEYENLTIYDGDDPNLPMWMDFDYGSSGLASITMLYANGKAVSALNGIVCSVGEVGWHDGLTAIDFIADTAKWRNSSYIANWTGGIGNRNVAGGYGSFITAPNEIIVAAQVNDVAMTVLPNARINDSTGLPIPTIALATDGGVSVILDNGSVFDSTDGLNWSLINISEANGGRKVVNYIFSIGGTVRHKFIDSISADWNTGSDGFYEDYPHTSASTSVASNGNSDVYGHSSGLMIYKRGNDPGSLSNADFDDSKARVTSSFNTGYMHGDIKSAFLSNTDDTNVTGTELVSNPGPYSNTTGWSVANAGFSVTNSNDRLVINSGTNTGSYFGASHALTLVSGKKYILTVNIHSQTKTAVIRMTGNGNYFTATGTGTGEHAFYFTANQASHTIFIGSDVGGSNRKQEVSSVSVKEISGTLDHSGNDKGLVPYGTITVNPVATGAELVSYGPFSTSNRLRQPYNSDLRFETNDFYVMFWMNNSGTNDHETLVSRDNREFDISIQDNTNYNRRFRIYAMNSSNSLQTFDSGNDPFVPNTWTHICVNYTSGNTVSIYVNGVLNNSGTLNYDIDDTSAGLNIGARNTSGSYLHPADGTKLALVRIGKNAPSAEQIKEIYNDEKCLYHENAKCTLHGTSDDVKALAFDDTNDVLHVGTSAGRSEFRGLNRINNTTTAVTTAISVSNEFVAEQ